ncbi:hypothetical protein GI582_11295 [Sulfitobacter sp. BDSS02]|nr:hypothetical protein [Sulfitobacter sp. BDSS02]MBR9850069.1 hypothetical protein [Paracoccaceae bacterium]
MSLRKNDRPEDEVPSSDSKSYMDRKLSWNARLELARQSREQVLNKAEGQSVLPDRKPWETASTKSDELDDIENATPEDAQRIARENRAEFLARMAAEREGASPKAEAKLTSFKTKPERSEPAVSKPSAGGNVLPLFGDGRATGEDVVEEEDHMAGRRRQPPRVGKPSLDDVTEDMPAAATQSGSLPIEAERRTAAGFVRIVAVVLLCLLVGAAIAFVAARALDRVGDVSARVDSSVIR